MSLNIVLSFTAFSGLILFIVGMFIIPSIEGASTGVSTYSLPPKPSATASPYVNSIYSPMPMATPMATPVPISALIEIPPPDNMKIITSSDGFKLILVGTVVFVVSMLIRICYRKDEDEISSRRIVPYQALVLNDVIVKPAVPLAVPAAAAIIHELKLQVHPPQPMQQFQPRPPYPPRGPVLQRTFKYPPPYDAFNKK